MNETILTIALIIAIIMDAMRIYQYIQGRKKTSPAMIELLVMKVFVLSNKYSIMQGNGNDADRIKYIVQHWHDKVS